MDRDQNTFRVKLSKNCVNVLSTCDETNYERQINILSTDMDNMQLRKKCFSEFDQFFENSLLRILDACDTEKQMNILFSLSAKLIESSQTLCLHLLKEKCDQQTIENVEPAIKKCFDYVQQKIDAYKTYKLRLREFKKNPRFVEPEEKMMGMKWKTKTAPNRNIPDHTLVPTTFQSVPLLKTLNRLFMDDDFRNQYFTYNKNRFCEPDVFTDFCCGSTFKENDLFRLHPDALQIELAIDDFETCSPIKSKATMHKICAVYFRIRNIPPELNSKLNNIHLLALCESSHLKPDNCSINDILEHIVREFQELEAIGIEIAPGKFIKGSLISTSHDNLGANGLFGYVECFVAAGCCRFCVCNQKEFQTSFVEQSHKMRNIESYSRSINQIEEDESGNTIVDGIKRYCILNNLKFYHMLKNTSIDLMHDVNEGVVPYFVKFFLNYLVNNRILNLTAIQSKIRDFNYGTLEKRNKPSFIKINNHNLGQNASQIVCVMRHLPFIFFHQRNQLGNIWSMMVDLLQIMQILYSTKVKENDVQQLKRLIENHLTDLVSHGLSLLFKHHMLTHYPNVIEKTGPVIHNWMMRYESAHKEFTHRAHTTNNFINIAKTLAYSHQEKICLKNMSQNDFQFSKKCKKLTECNDHQKYIHLLPERNVNETVVLDFLFYSSYEYRQGLIILNDQCIHMIHTVLHDRKQNEFLIVCELMNVCGFEKSLNSIEITKTQSFYVIMNVESLKIKETFDKIIAGERMYVFAKNLDFSELN